MNKKCVSNAAFTSNGGSHFAKYWQAMLTNLQIYEARSVKSDQKLERIGDCISVNLNAVLVLRIKNKCQTYMSSDKVHHTRWENINSVRSVSITLCHFWKQTCLSQYVIRLCYASFFRKKTSHSKTWSTVIYLTKVLCACLEWGVSCACLILDPDACNNLVISLIRLLFRMHFSGQISSHPFWLTAFSAYFLGSHIDHFE